MPTKKMSRKQPAAPRASIAKWRRYAREGLKFSERLGCAACPLCKANPNGCDA